MIEKIHIINGVGPKNKLLVFLEGFLVKKKRNHTLAILMTLNSRIRYNL